MNESIVRLNEETLIRLYEAATRADAEGRSFRICTGTSMVECQGTLVRRSWVKWDVGNTGWTPPYYSE